MQILKRRVLLSSSLALASVLAACGGGGGSSGSSNSGAGTPSTPTPIAATINEGNYLNAVALTGLAADRLDDVNTMIAYLYSAVIATQGLTGSYPCPLGGSVNVGLQGSSYTFTAQGCRFASYTVQSGTITATGASASLVNGVYYLMGGNFAFTDVDYLSQAQAGNQVMNGQFKLVRNGDLSLDASGQASVRRNGRTDTYTQLQVRTGTPDTRTHEVQIDKLAFRLETPRFPLALTVAGDSRTGTITATDSSSITFTQQTTAYKYELRRTTGAAPFYTATLTDSDAAFKAALEEMLK